MNRIREARAARKSDTDIVNELFRYGLLEEKRIERQYEIDAILYSRAERKKLRELKKLAKTVEDVHIE
jgi:hypothetical protein